MTKFAVFAFATFFALNLDVFAFDTGILPVPPSVVVGALAALACLHVSRATGVLKSPLWRTCAAFSVLAMFGFLGAGQDQAAWQAVQSSWLSVIYVSAWLLLLADTAHRRAALLALGFALAAALAFNVVELFHPMRWSSVHGRAAGTFVNPNLSALGILAATAALAASRAGNRACAAALVAAGVAILPTFSRGGVALWVALGLFVLFFSRRFRARHGLVALTASAGVLVTAFLFLPEDILEIPNVAQRLDVLRGEGFADASSAWRRDLVEEGARLFAERPLMGHGPAAGARIELGGMAQGAHNDHLALGINFGLAGLLVWLAFLFHLRRRRRIPLLILVGGAALFFHSVLLNRQVLFALALAESEERP